MKRFSRHSCRGFTLTEILISMFVFTVMMVSVSQISSTAFFGYRNTRAIQRDIENAQFSMNVIAKELRTSSVVAPVTGPFPINSSSVKFYDYSQEKCFQYRIDSNTNRLEVDSSNDVDADACRARVFGSFLPVSTGVIAGSFRVTPSAPGTVGKVTMFLDISEGPSHHARIQTTVSLRDFAVSGI